MNILVQLVHPAHFHYYRKTIDDLKQKGHKVVIAITTKDILEKIVNDAGYEYINVMPVSHKSTKIGYLYDMIMRNLRILHLCVKHKIDILTGSSIEISQIGWLLRKPSINIGEDDANIVGKYINAIAPFVDVRLTPDTCNNGKITNKSVFHPGYLELGYLHPNHFTADKSVVEGYGIDITKPYFIMRFASLKAHHDDGIKGINTEIAQLLVDILSPHGQIYITSERELEPQFEPYRIRINPLDMHHVMAFASLYIGDSQTMAAEAGVLGTPFVRFNDFVGRIGYLRELEDDYELGYGIHASVLTEDSPIRRNDGTLQPSGTEALYRAVEALVAMPADERQATFSARREKMLSEKIDYAKFLTWFIENYPSSAKETRDNQHNPDFWQQFK